MEWSFIAQAVGLAAIAVVIVQQILKSKVIPIYFANKYPQLTNIILSAIAAVVVVWQTGIILPVTIWEWISYIGLISVVAAITYNNLVQGWSGVRATEK